MQRYVQTQACVKYVSLLVILLTGVLFGTQAYASKTYVSYVASLQEGGLHSYFSASMMQACSAENQDLYDIGAEGEALAWDGSCTVTSNTSGTPIYAGSADAFHYGTSFFYGSVHTIDCPDGQRGAVKEGGSAEPYCVPPPKLPDCGCTGETLLSPLIGDPVNSVSGDVVENEVDFKMGGASPLFFERLYNSSVAFQSHYGAANGWASNFGIRLYDGLPRTTLPSDTSYLALASSASLDASIPAALTVYRPNGSIYIFNRTPGTGIFTSDPDINAKIVLSSTGYTYTDLQSGRVDYFNSSGSDVLIQYRNGTSISVTAFDSLNRGTTITDNFGNSLSFTYVGTSGRVATMTTPAGTYSYQYDSNGMLISVTDPDARVRSYVYNESANTAGISRPHSLTGIIDENSNRFVTFQYNSLGKAVASQQAGGANAYSFAYNSDGTTAVTDPLGATRTYSYLAPQGVPYVSGISAYCPGCFAAMTLDANGNPATRTDFNGNVTHYTYDLSTNLETSRTEAYGTARARTITTTWNSTFRLPATITEPGRTTTYTYDSNGNPLSKAVTDTATSNTQTWSWTYNSVGQVLTATGPRTDISTTTTYTYSTAGNLSTITNPLGQVTTFSNYNGSGYPQTIVDPNGLTTALTYDARNRLTSQVTGTETTSYTYDGVGQLTQVTLPSGNSVSYVYDNAHRLTEIHDLAGDKIVYTLDAAGNHLSEKITDSGGLSLLLKRIDQGLAHARLFASR